MAAAEGEGPPAPRLYGGRVVPTATFAPEEKALIDQFRERLSAQFEELPDDMTLLRFLRARSMELDPATLMYTNHRAFRDTHEADTIIWDFHFPERDRVVEVYPAAYHKTGRLGHPLYIERVGQLDVEALLRVTTVERYIKYHIQAYEDMITNKLPACAIAANRPVTQGITILDLNGISMSFLLNSENQALLKRVIGIDQDNYPECLYKMFVVNAPRMFTMAYSLIKNFIDPVTREKIQIFGSSFIGELEKHIDIKNIPDFLGGKSKWDPRVQPGPWEHILPAPREASVEKFGTPRHPAPRSESPCRSPSPCSLEEIIPEEREWAPIAPNRVRPLGTAGLLRFARRSQKRGMFTVVAKEANNEQVAYKTINCWGGVYSSSNSSRLRLRASSKTERMEEERRILQDMAGRVSPEGTVSVSYAFHQAATARNVDDLAQALAAGSAPNHDGMIQVKLAGGLFPKWAQLFVSVAGGVLVCKEAPWAKDALAPASLLQATGVSLNQGRYIKVEGLKPPLELWHEEEHEAMTWFITLWCSRIMSRVAAHLTALDQDQVSLD